MPIISFSVILARAVQVSRPLCLVQGDLAAICYYAATFFLAAATCFRTLAYRTQFLDYRLFYNKKNSIDMPHTVGKL